jgi:PAS domain S-box-containing protein
VKQTKPVRPATGRRLGNRYVSIVYPTPFQLFLFTAFAIFAGEVVVMLILAMIQPLGIASEALVDGVMVTVIVTPFLYLFMFRPMVLHIAERKAAEEALQTLNADLEERVAERTADLANTNRQLLEEVEDRKRAELNLQKSSDFIRRVVESAPCMLLIFDANSAQCSFVNSSIADLLGYAPEEVQSSDFDLFDKVFAPEDRAKFSEMRNQILVGETDLVTSSLNLVKNNGAAQPCRIKLEVFSKTPTNEPKELLLSAICG